VVYMKKEDFCFDDIIIDIQYEIHVK